MPALAELEAGVRGHVAELRSAVNAVERLVADCRARGIVISQPAIATVSKAGAGLAFLIGAVVIVLLGFGHQAWKVGILAPPLGRR